MDNDDKDELKRFIDAAAEKVADKVSSKQTVVTVHTTLKAMGMDVDNPLELQQDFAHLRSRRLDKENTGKAMKDASLRYVVVATMSGIIAWLVAHAPGGTP